MSWPKHEWDESPHPEFCPQCGLGLARAECRECAAPLTVVHEGGEFFGGGYAFGRYCPRCGEDNAAPTEPQMREKPKKKAKPGTGQVFRLGLSSGDGWISLGPTASITFTSEDERPAKKKPRKAKPRAKRKPKPKPDEEAA